MAAGDRGVRLRLHDILGAIAGIRDTVAGLGFETYVSVWWIKHASERGIEIISEASRHIPEEMKASFPAIPWKQIAGIGNVLRHDYAVVSDRVIWDVIVDHLDPLEAAVRQLLARIEGEDRSRSAPPA